MTKPIRLSVQIPFPGFYGSDYDAAFDREPEQWAEWRASEDNGSDEDEARHPEELRLSESELFDLIFDATDYRAGYEKIAEWYVESFAYQFGEAFGYQLAPEFEEMTSPREYNFTTDRLFAKVRLSVFRAMMRDHKADGYNTLCEVIRDRHTSRSGFASFYRTDLKADWLSKPLRDWDHNELCTLLIASALLKGRADTGYADYSEGVESDTFRNDVFDGVADGDGFYQAWEGCVDWAKLETKREEARQDKLDALREEAPERWAELSGQALDGDASTLVRCPETLELFEARPF